MNIDDIKIYLPKFLSSVSEIELFEGLNGFPNNLDGRLYTKHLVNSKLIYQGDGWMDLLVVNLPDQEHKPVPGMVLWKTCDIDLKNLRNFPSKVVYAPIVNLKNEQQTVNTKSTKTKKQRE